MDVIVYDEDFTGFGDKIEEFGQKLEDIFDRYIACMEKMGTQGFCNGDTSDNIRYFVSSISVLKDDVRDFTQYVKENCNNFISDLDEADNFLY